jgi:hypothetical protein
MGDIGHFTRSPEFIFTHLVYLSFRSGGLCAQPGVRCLQCLDLGRDLPLEKPTPGELGLTENLEATLSVKQFARDGAQLCLPLACCRALRRWRGCSSLAARCHSLPGGLWWLGDGWRSLLLGPAQAFLSGSFWFLQASRLSGVLCWPSRSRPAASLVLTARSPQAGTPGVGEVSSTVRSTIARGRAIGYALL